MSIMPELNDALDLIALNQDLKRELDAANQRIAVMGREIAQLILTLEQSHTALILTRAARDAARADRDQSDRQLRQLIEGPTYAQTQALAAQRANALGASDHLQALTAAFCTCVPGRADVLTGRTP